MKKIYFIFATLIILSIACTKEENKIASTENDKGVREYLSVDPTEAKIQNFINRMDLVREDPNYSGSENWNYSQDSAVWYVEAALNYKYSYPAETHNLSYKDSVVYSLNIDNNQVGINTLTNAFDALIDSISNIYFNFKYDDKFLLLVDIKSKCIDQNKLLIKMYVIIAYSGGSSGGILPNGDWKVANGDFGYGGLCGQSGWNRYDARDKIVQLYWINNSTNFPGGASTQSSIVSVISEGAVDLIVPVTVTNPYEPGLWLFYNSWLQNPNNYVDCLSNSRIQFYASNVALLVSARENYHVNKHCIDVSIFWDWSLCCNSQEYNLDLILAEYIDRGDPPLPIFYDKYTL